MSHTPSRNAKGYVNLTAVLEAIKLCGGDQHVTEYSDHVHRTFYIVKDNAHISFDEYPDGTICNVHTDRDGRKYCDYQGGYY